MIVCSLIGSNRHSGSGIHCTTSVSPQKSYDRLLLQLLPPMLLLSVAAIIITKSMPTNTTRRSKHKTAETYTNGN